MSSKIVDEDLTIDDLDKICIVLELDENGCFLMKEAFREYCGKRPRKKRSPSPYNVFMGACIRERPKGEAVREAMRRCARAWKEKKKKET